MLRPRVHRISFSVSDRLLRPSDGRKFVIGYDNLSPGAGHYGLALEASMARAGLRVPMPNAIVGDLNLYRPWTPILPTRAS